MNEMDDGFAECGHHQSSIINHQSVVDENRKKFHVNRKKFHVETFLAEKFAACAVGTRNSYSVGTTICY